jgi:hypothetical protein
MENVTEKKELSQEESILGAELASPVSCNGTLTAFNPLIKGKITSEIIIAKEYYFNPANQEGSLDERRTKLNEVIKKVFGKFFSERTQEYENITCKYHGIDWNQAGSSSWRTITCDPGFAFVPGTIDHTQNGDWKEGPNYNADYTSLSWKTGGHRRSETYVNIDAKYANVKAKVNNELNQAREVLHEAGIPTSVYPEQI